MPRALIVSLVALAACRGAEAPTAPVASGSAPPPPVIDAGVIDAGVIDAGEPDAPLADIRDASGAATAETGSHRGHVTGSFFHMVDVAAEATP